jgi:hypothetical protein
VKLRITKVNRKGMVIVSFNQKLLVPSFAEENTTENQTRRQLGEVVKKQREDI